MKEISPQLAFAFSFAILALITITIGHYGRNVYFTIAAAAFAIATYVTYPPTWALALVKLLPGNKRDNNRRN